MISPRSETGISQMLVDADRQIAGPGVVGGDDQISLGVQGRGRSGKVRVDGIDEIADGRGRTDGKVDIHRHVGRRGAQQRQLVAGDIIDGIIVDAIQGRRQGCGGRTVKNGWPVVKVWERGPIAAAVRFPCNVTRVVDFPGMPVPIGICTESTPEV